MSPEYIPMFATNGLYAGMTVGGEVNRLFKLLRERMAFRPPIKLATAYINAQGFALLADELEQASHIKLLLGAEPDPELARAVVEHGADWEQVLSKALVNHDGWLKAERDTMGFTLQSNEDAKRMVTWLRSHNEDGNPKVEVRRFYEGFLHGKAYISADPALPAALAGSSNLTAAGLSLNAELNLGFGSGDQGHTQRIIEWFNSYWDLSKPYDLAALYERQWDPHSPLLIFMRMLWELYGKILNEEKPQPTELRLSLTRFQTDGVARMERLIETLGGVLVADEVGLGKTYLAAEVIYKATEKMRQRVLIIAPAALKRSMWEPFLEQHGFRLTKVLSYEELRNNMDPEGNPAYDTFVAQMEEYALIVIDEAHNLRNAAAARSAAVDRVILGGKYPKKVVLLTATPVNNSLYDLETLIKYFIRDDALFAPIGIPSIREYIKRAQAMDPESLTPEHLFDLMDQVAVRRTRRFIIDQYPGETIIGANGQPMTISFPKPKVRRIEYEVDKEGLALIDRMINALTVPDNADEYTAYMGCPADPEKLLLARYKSSAYLVNEESEGYQSSNAGLLRSAILKRLESSPHALLHTLDTLIVAHSDFLGAIDGGYVLIGEALKEWASSESDDLDEFISQLDDADIQQVNPIEYYRAEELRRDVASDLVLLQALREQTRVVATLHDKKVDALVQELIGIAAAARKPDPGGLTSEDRRKTIIFSSFSDTVIAVHEAVSGIVDNASAGSPLSDFKGRIAPPILGAYVSVHQAGKSGGIDQGGRAITIEHFAPKTAGQLDREGRPLSPDMYDLLFTTDVLSEGVNLQQAGQIINYDLPWNPMRIVQRHGRVDRIGSLHSVVQLGLFFPDERLDEMLGLEETLNRKLAQADAAVGTGQVLPERRAGYEVILTDPELAITQMEELLESRGSSAALSGEEYRRRLFNTIQHDEVFKHEIIELPYGVGSGFENPNVTGNAYVFCIKIGEHGQPWFRFVPVDEGWNPIIIDDSPGVQTDTLTCLIAADPGSEAMPRVMDDTMYSQAFTAWEAAQNSVFEAWQLLTDVNALQPDTPKSFRDAANLVIANGSFLGREKQRVLLARLSSVPPTKVSRAIRTALNQGASDQEKIELVLHELDAAGIQQPPKHDPLPKVSKEEVRLIAWMAVKGGKKNPDGV